MPTHDGAIDWEHTDPEKIRADLEARLNAQVSWDTEIAAFFEIVGLREPSWLPHNNPDVRDLYLQIMKKKFDRLAHLPKMGQGWHKRVYGTLMNLYLHQEARTLADLKALLETGPKRVDKIGNKGLTYLNELLNAYGLEPIRSARSGDAPQ